MARDELKEYARLEYDDSETAWIVSQLRREAKRVAQSRRNVLRQSFRKHRGTLDVTRRPSPGPTSPVKKSSVMTEAEGGACDLA